MMKMRLLAIVGLVALTQASCALLSGGKSQEAPPAATTEPSQPSSASPPPAPSGPAEISSPTPTMTSAAPMATEPPAITETLSPTAAAGRPPVSLPGPQAGPEILDLDNSPDLFKHPLIEYISRMQDDSSGADPNGQPSAIVLRFQARYQAFPAEAWNSVEALFKADAKVETVQVNGKQFVVSDGNCTEAEPGLPPQSPVGALEGAFTGKATRVAQGVEINGLLVDQYAIGKENLKKDQEVTFITENGGEGSTNSATMSVRLTGSGSLYVSQQGGFVVRLELTDNVKATDEMPFFQPGSDLSRTTLFELAPTLPDADPVTLPDACASLAGGSEGESGEVTPQALSLPRPDNAEVLTDTGDYQALSVSDPIELVEEFYKTEMLAQGFNLQSADKVGPIVELTFEKDGMTVDITLIASGENVMITVIQQ